MDGFHPWNFIPLDYTNLNWIASPLDGALHTPRFESESVVDGDGHSENELPDPVPSPAAASSPTTDATLPNSMAPPRRPIRKKKAKTLREEDWAPVKDRVLELLKDNSLREVRGIILTEFGFEATERQYKSILNKWNVAKNIRRHEMKAIVRKRQRRIVADSKPNLNFSLRGDSVPEEKIERFMKRENIPHDTLYSPSSGAETPADGILDCWTPATPLSAERTPTPSLLGRALATTDNLALNNAISSPALSSITALEAPQPFEGRSPRPHHRSLVTATAQSEDVRLQRQLASLEALHEERSEATLGTLLELGILLVTQGRYSSAEIVARKRLAACRSLYGDMHTDTGISINLLGDILVFQGSFHSALKLQQRAASILEKTVGLQSEHFLQTQASQGHTYLCLYLVEEAVDILRRSEETAVRVFGRLSTVTLKLQQTLLKALICSREFLEAEQLAKWLKLVLSKDSPNLLICELALQVDVSLGQILLGTSRLNEAGELLQSSWRKAAEVFGSEHPSNLWFLYAMAEFFMRSGQFDEAISTIDRCITSRGVVLGSSHPHTKSSIRLKEEILRKFDVQNKYR